MLLSIVRQILNESWWGLSLKEKNRAHGDCVHVGRGQVGIITSGIRSPILRKNIALCRIDVKVLKLELRV
ncbi:MAG: hypothetical protein Ct9H300mP28_10940 [Pseudomonadota bacterium]|nr:MAG: hypothetical protein Ct9H300mP28_10940 [Pseudomonadota bacterium]